MKKIFVRQRKNISMWTFRNYIAVGVCMAICTLIVVSLLEREPTWSRVRTTRHDADDHVREKQDVKLTWTNRLTANGTTKLSAIKDRTQNRAPPRVKNGGFLHEDVKDLIKEGFVPNNVYYVWCGVANFEFRHYISILSAIHFLKPDKITFYHHREPDTDPKGYNTWFQDLKATYPFFSMVRDNVCGEGTPDKIYQELSTKGGIYIQQETIFNAFPLQFKNFSFIQGFSKYSQPAFIVADVGVPVESLIKEPNYTAYKSKTVQCVSSEELNENSSSVCVSNVGDFYPKDIWTAESAFAALVRKLFYGSPELAQPLQDFSTLVPNIAHMVWIGGGEMDFLFFTGIISLIYVAHVETVYIHGDTPPTGQYWHRIQDHPKLQFIRRYPAPVFGNEIGQKEHVSDVWRADLMIKYGGLYVDTDSVFIRPLDRNIRGYDAVATYDWPGTHYPFPDIINLGVTIGKRNAKFWQLFQQSMKWFIDSDWTFNGLRQPYKVMERNPKTMKIDPHLQVTCYYQKCHPTWYPDYHNEDRHHLNGNSITNWRETVYSFHWTFPVPPELENFEKLLNSDTLFAEVGKYIFEKADMLHTENRTVIYFNGETEIIP